MELEVGEIDADFVAGWSGDSDSLVLIGLVNAVDGWDGPGRGEGVSGEADVDLEGGIGVPDSVLF